MSIFGSTQKWREIRYGAEKSINPNLVKQIIVKTDDFVKGF